MRDTSVPVGAQCGAAAAQEILDANVAPQTSAKSDGPTAFTDTPPPASPRPRKRHIKHPAWLLWR